jgi:hypothetical protein
MNVKRVDPQQVADERTALREWLEYHRATLLMKIDGLTDAQARARSIASSNLSLLGLLRHMVVVERYWFTWVIGGVQAAPIYITWEDENLDFNFDDAATLAEALNSFNAELVTSRGFEAACESLDSLAARSEVRDGADFQPDLRWVMVHMIEEYARHNGHADLLREAIDGVTGD